jgi:hypothetical protein
MEFNEYYRLSEINKEQFDFLNYVYSTIIHKSRTYNEIEKNINLLKNDKLIYILKFGYEIESFNIYNFHLRWLFCNNLIKIDNTEYNQLQKDYNLGYQYFENNFKKTAPSVNHIEMLFYNFNNDWKQKLTTVYGKYENMIKDIYYNNGFLAAYIEYEKNHKYLFEKIITTATAPEPTRTDLNKVEVLINEPQTATAPEPQQINLHNNIFTKNNFLKFQRLFDEFEINHTKRTHLRFIFEKMKHENEIHNTTNLKNYIDWLNETYQFENPITELKFTNINENSNRFRLSIYNNIK